jgi:N utilization substance protein B
VARRRAREVAFQALFQADRGATPVLDAWLELRSELAEEPDDEPYAEALAREDVEFAERLVRAYDGRKGEIDRELAALIQGWSFGQMAQTDLNVLRLALAEMALAETPAVVAVEMAVRLAKRFGGEDSGRFVNGVLAKVLRRAAPVAEGAA